MFLVQVFSIPVNSNFPYNSEGISNFLKETVMNKTMQHRKLKALCTFGIDKSVIKYLQAYKSSVSREIITFRKCFGCLNSFEQ